MNLKPLLSNLKKLSLSLSSAPAPEFSMGRSRKAGGGMGLSPFLTAVMKKRINDYLSPESIAEHLCLKYPEYNRYKPEPFVTEVEQVLDKKRREMDDDDDEREIEIDHIPKRMRRTEYDHDLSSSSVASVDSASDSEFDLMKNMLRAGYGSKPKPKAKEEKNLEVEVEDVRKENKAVASLSGMEDESVKGLGGRSSTVVNNKGNTKRGPGFKDLGGMKAVLKQLKMEFFLPLCYPQLPRRLGGKPMAGILLHGPPGCGKTKLAHAIANQTGLPFYHISATELVSAVSGASEENIRDLFSKAYRTAPSIVFIDEIDAIASKRENLQRETDRRIVTQLLTCMDEFHNDKNSDSEAADKRTGYVLVIGATNRPDAIDPALRRPGRFDREISLGVPDVNARLEILSVLTQNLSLAGDFDMMKIAKATQGFVGADLANLVNKAGNLALQRIVYERVLEISKEGGEPDEEWWMEPWSPEEMEKLSITMSDFELNITMSDFEEAAKMVQPSLRREGFSAIPDVTWDDVGGLHELRKELYRHVVRRIKHPERSAKFGIDMETGILLYGPPGCGKTLIAKAVANEAGANFIHIKGPELLNKYVGESELQLRTIFSRARTSAPCILFFDEVDALTTKRGKEGGWVVERLVTQLLCELDGVDKRQGVYVIGATNRLDMIDDALLRPGRFGTRLFVPLPSPDERGLILKALGRRKPIDPSVDLLAQGKSPDCEKMSAADLAALMNEAAMAAEDEMESMENFSDNTTHTIKSTHIEQAKRKVSPSVSAKTEGKQKRNKGRKKKKDRREAEEETGREKKEKGRA